MKVKGKALKQSERAHAGFTVVSEGGEVVNEAVPQSGSCWFNLTQSSRHPFIQIKDHVSVLAGSLTSSCPSALQLPPLLRICILTRGHAFWKIPKLFVCYCAFACLWTQAWRDVIQRNAQGEATPWHTLLSLGVPGWCDWDSLPTTCSKTGDGAMCDPSTGENRHHFESRIRPNYAQGIISYSDFSECCVCAISHHEVMGIKKLKSNSKPKESWWITKIHTNTHTFLSFSRVYKDRNTNVNTQSLKHWSNYLYV